VKSAMEYLSKVTPVIVTGSRDWEDEEYVHNILDRMRAKFQTDLLVVHGCCRGVDTFAENWAKIREQPYRGFPGQFNRRGSAGGPWRNAVMIHHGWIADDADEPVYPVVLAIHEDINTSRGTVDCINRALEQELVVYLFDGSTYEKGADKDIPLGKLQVAKRKKAKQATTQRSNDETSAG